jgi:hypothetical protein
LNVAPHSLQNLEFAGFSVWQFGHFTMEATLQSYENFTLKFTKDGEYGFITGEYKREDAWCQFKLYVQRLLGILIFSGKRLNASS